MYNLYLHRYKILVRIIINFLLDYCIASHNILHKDFFYIVLHYTMDLNIHTTGQNSNYACFYILTNLFIANQKLMN